MNIAITSASRKNWLIRAAQEALARNGGGMVYAIDSDPLASALYEADVPVVCPRSDEPHFQNWFLSFCRSNLISIVLPSRDSELAYYAQFPFDADVLVAGSPAGAIRLCQDKREFARLCDAIEVGRIDEIAPNSETDFPVFVKPRYSCDKVPKEIISSLGDYRRQLPDPERFLIQRYIAGAEEFSIDVFVDWSGRTLASIPRRRVKTASGESIVTHTLDDRELALEAARLCERLGIRGHAVAQAFREANHISFIEVNPRVGGASLLSFQAGCRSIDWLIQICQGKTVEPLGDRYTRNLWMFRSASDLFVDGAELVGEAGELHGRGGRRGAG